MTFDQIATILITAGTFLTMLFTKIKAETAFFTAMALLCLTGVLGFEETFSGMDSSSVLTVGVLYIVIAGLKYAGALEWIVSHIMGTPKSYSAAIIRLMLPVGLLSSVMSNTACTALFQDVVRMWAQKLKMPASKLLIPLAYAASVGGLMTLIGTPPNLIISSLYTGKSGQTFNLLTTLPVGAAILIAAVTLVVLMRNCLPDRKSDNDADFEESIRRMKATANPRKTFVSITIMVSLLVISACNILPLTTCCLGAGILMVITRCCTSQQAFDEVDWRVIIIFTGSICIGKAMDSCGLDAMICDGILDVAGKNPYVVLTVLCCTAATTTEFMSDTGCAAMFFPIAWEAAESLGVSPMPFMVALMMSVSSSYATPIATPPNTIVYQSGGYRFADFARIGVPLKIVAMIITILLTTWIYPF